MPALTPKDLGLKPDAWRAHQLDTINHIMGTDDVVTLLDAPTGAGKSLIALGTARMSGGKTFIITQTKSLQNQYAEEGGDLVRTIMGKNNYPCILWGHDKFTAASLGVHSTTTVDDAPCASGYDCPVRPWCPYFVDREAALASAISIHNYAYWIPESNYVGGFGRAEYIFADEGHLLDSALCDFSSVRIPEKLLRDIPEKVHILSHWKTWAVDALAAMYKGKAPKDGVERTRWNAQTALLGKLKDIPLDNDTRWVVSYTPKELLIRPVWPLRSRELLVKGRRVVIMSGTILDHQLFSEIIGIGDHGYVKLPWTFPVEGRPIYYRPAAEVTQSNKDAAIPNLARVVDYILDTHKGEKGVIHCRSFALGSAVAKRISDQDRLIVHERGMDRGDVISKFKHDRGGKWLISPSVSHGEDFAYDVARCQVILKMPFPDYGDPLVRLRAKQKPEWYYYATAQELVQMIGRVNRAEDDYGETWITDSKFDVFATKYRRFIPEEIWDAVR